MNKLTLLFIATTVALICSTTISAQSDYAPLSENDEQQFQNPPKENRPEIWFHFIGGNVSKLGIDADLEAISKAGFQGVHWFHGAVGGQWPGVTTSIKALTPEWEELVAYVGQKAHQEGLRFTIQTCPGWAMAGGPWVKPRDAMRQLVWSRTDIAAGQHAAQLPLGQPSNDEWRDYQDICVLAFPTPDGDTGKPLNPENVASDDEAWTKLITNQSEKAYQSKKGSHKAEFQLPKGSILRTLELPSINSMSHAWVYKPGVHVTLKAITASGAKQETLVETELPMSNWQDGAPLYLACNEVNDVEKYILTLTTLHDLSLRYIRLWQTAYKNSWQGEAGWTLLAKELSQEHTRQSATAFIKGSDIADLTKLMDARGNLNWTAPTAHDKWTILRIGHVNTGRKNGPAPAEATGWECNKLDPKGADVQFSNYVGRLQDGPLKGTADGMLMDSWECHNQTWTDSMETEFLKQRGYELRSWIPALMGYVIDNQELTSRFLIDWRRALTELYTENFFHRMTDLAHDKGMHVQYETAGGDVVAMDAMQFFKYADTPMCEFWHPISEGYVGDLNFKPIKPTASAAHIYGKRRVDAESFTSFDLNWDEYWQMLKEVANLNMTEGVTHNVFHTYTHNPQVNFLPPGTSFGSKIGTPFLRGQTWWKYMSYFTTYLARTSYMLERGMPVVDVLWYLGDEVGHRPDQFAPFPEGFKYDYCNTDALLNRMAVKDGHIVTPEGITYEVLWIPENERMLPETVEKLHSLLNQGAKVVAQAPVSPATLTGGTKMQKQFRKLVKSLWSGSGIRKVGKGQLAIGLSIDEALNVFNIQPHIKTDEKVQWTMRQTEGAQWFYITTAVGQEFHGTLQLRANGKAELWDAVNGEMYALKAETSGEYQRIRLDLSRAENAFIVFREQGSRHIAEMQRPNLGKKINPEGWTLSFPSGWGAPEEKISLASLQPWKDLFIGAEGKAFSGTATYETTFTLSDYDPTQSYILNLGNVDMIADVKVNSKPAGVIWAEPYRLYIGDKLQKGKNTVSVDVTSTWFNRLAYDASQPEQQRKTWTIAGPTAGSPLRPSGLLGPVAIEY